MKKEKKTVKMHAHLHMSDFFCIFAHKFLNYEST